MIIPAFWYKLFDVYYFSLYVVLKLEQKQITWSKNSEKSFENAT